MKLNLPISLFKNFLAVLGLHCCTGFSLIVASWAYSLVLVSELLIGKPPLLWRLLYIIEGLPRWC